MEGRTFLEFRDSGRTLDVNNLISPNLDFIHEERHTFKVERIISKGFLRGTDHQRNQ